MSNYTREEMVNMMIVEKKAHVQALGMIIERVKDYESLKGVSNYLHEALRQQVESLYISRDSLKRELEPLLEEQGDFIQARMEDVNENN